MSNEQHNQAIPEPSQQPSQAPESGLPRAGDDVLNLLDQIGGHLEALRKIKAERDAHALESAQREAELAARQQQIDEAAAAVQKRAEEAHALERQIEFSRAETTTESQRLSQLAQQLESRTRELDDKFQKAEQRLGELDQRERELGERLKKFEQSAEELRAQSVALSRRETELGEAGKRDAGEMTGLRTRLDEAERARAQLVQQLETLNAELTATRQRAESLGAELASARSEVERATAELATAGQRITQLEREVAAGRENRVPPEQIAKYEKAIATLRERLEASEKRGKSLSNELEDTKNRINESSDVEQLATNALRRERLRVYKALLQQQARKLSQAKKMLAKKQEEIARGGGVTSGGITSAKIEQENAKLIEARRLLANERAEIATLRQTVEKKLAKKTSMIGVACASATLVAILIGSWFVAGKFVKPVYNASATIGIDTREIEEGSDKIASWTEFQKQLVTDPQVLDQAAQRFDARGFKQLSTPSDVRAFLGSSLEVADVAPGQIALTIKGEGADRTARVLETLVTALVSYSNDTRDLRADQASTVVVAGAKASGEPVEDPRIAIAGAIAGGASALALFLGVMMWRSITQEMKGPPEPAYAVDEQAMQSVEASPGDATVGTSGVAKSIAARRPI